MRNTMQRTAQNNQIISRPAFGTSAHLRKSRDRRNAARFNVRILQGIGADVAAPYMSAQALSASRNEEDGGCLGRLLNQLRVLDHARRESLSAFIATEVRLMNAKMPMDPLREAFAALDAEEDADCGDSNPQQAFNRNPNKETARVLRESLEVQRDATSHAIDALRQFEDSAE